MIFNIDTQDISLGSVLYYINKNCTDMDVYVVTSIYITASIENNYINQEITYCGFNSQKSFIQFTNADLNKTVFKTKTELFNNINNTLWKNV